MKTGSFEIAAFFSLFSKLAISLFVISTISKAAPANDNFAAAEVISGQSGSVVGTTVSATVESGEPYHALYYTGPSVWYRWTAPVSGYMQFNTNGSQISNAVAVYTGTQLSSLTEIASNYSATGTFAVIAGTEYRIAVVSPWEQGSFVLNWAEAPPPPANDNFATAAVISGQSGSVAGTTASATHENGEPYHAGYSGLNSVWYSWTAPANGWIEFALSSYGLGLGLAVYEGNEMFALTPVASNYVYSQGAVTFPVSVGNVYKIAVDSYWTHGAFALNWGLAPPPPVNDNFAAAAVITGQSGSVAGTTVSATRESGEYHTGYSGPSVWYRWTAPANGYMQFNTNGSQTSNVVAVYTGTQVSSLTVIASNYSATGTFAVIAGTEYRIAVVSSGTDGLFVLNWAEVPPPPANDNFATAAVISGQSGSVTGTTLSATIENGEPSHAGNYSGLSVWYLWTAPANGYMEFNTSGSQAPIALAVYTGTQVNALIEIVSNSSYPQSRVTFAVTAGTEYRIAVGAWLEGAFVLNWAEAPPPPANDNFAAAAVISGQSGSVTGTTVSATRESGEPSHPGFGSEPSVWYRWTASADGEMEFNTYGSETETILAVFTGTDVTSLTQFAGNYSSTRSHVTFAVTAGTEYRIEVSGGNFLAGGPFILNWAAAPPPPANDSFSAALSLGAFTAVSSSGTWQGASSETGTGEPNLAGYYWGEDHRTVWFSWTAPAGVTWARVTLSGTNLRNQLAVYTGESLESLTAVRVNERAIAEPNRCTFPTVPGTTYRFRAAIDPDSFIRDLPVPEIPDFDFDLQLQTIVNAVTAAELILKGRGGLEEGIPSALVQAKADFAAARALEPANQEAAALLALAQLLTLEGETGFTTLLGNLGIPATGALREQGYPVPEDLEGFPVFANGANSSQAVDWLVTRVLPRLAEVRSALNAVTQNAFRTDLTASEAGTTDGDTYVDRGDALAMKAGTRSLEMLINLLGTYDLAVPLNDLADLDRQGELSAERVLQSYQSLLGFATSDRRVQFAAALRDLRDDYLAASDVIRDLRTNVAPESLGFAASGLDEQTDDSLRGDLSLAADSLDNEVLLRGNRLNLSRFLTTSDAMRDWLPEMRGNDVLGPLPDPTLDGILPGNTQTEVENRLYELGRLWGMGQYAVEVGDYLEFYGLASAPGEDADGDGKSNFNEWIFGSDPVSGEVMYQAGLTLETNAQGQREIRFSFIRTINLQDWKLVVAVSDDLASWDDTEATVEPVGAPVPTGDGFTEVVTYRLRPEVGFPQRKYFRVESRPKP